MTGRGAKQGAAVGVAHVGSERATNIRHTATTVPLTQFKPGATEGKHGRGRARGVAGRADGKSRRFDSVRSVCEHSCPISAEGVALH